MTARTVLTAVVAAVALLLTGCGDVGDSGDVSADEHESLVAGKDRRISDLERERELDQERIRELEADVAPLEADVEYLYGIAEGSCEVVRTSTAQAEIGGDLFLELGDLFAGDLRYVELAGPAYEAAAAQQELADVGAIAVSLCDGGVIDEHLQSR